MYNFLLFIFLAAMDSSYYETITTENSPKQAVESLITENEVADVLLKADADTLIVFDIDEVLITTKDIFLKPELEATFLSMVKTAMQEAKTAEERALIEQKLSLSLTQSERVVVEERWPELLSLLQANNTKVIALTNHPTGKFGFVDDVAVWKVASLASFGFHFERSFPQLKNHTFTSLSKLDMPSPLYVDGVLFSRGYSKGQVLLEFLDAHAKWMPKRVIFIDDLLKNHESIREAMQARGIAYQGYHYKKAHLTSDEIDKELVAYQFDYLMDHGVWLSDTLVKEKRAQ